MLLAIDIRKNYNYWRILITEGNVVDRKFASVAMNENNPNWEKAISRENALYAREDDIRSPFTRDYTRILHSLAYRRLKHKTQVFYSGAGNDHVCTRIEHVAHVDSVSNSIARALGLNEELTRAIATGHDLGHAPFGHQGEKCINDLTTKYLGKEFWHEQNGVYFVDNIELLEDPLKCKQNLNLSYAVRDGIISHCGEVDQNHIVPRDISIPLENITKGGKYQAITWEGCVVKLADKIAYLGRDIEDASRLGYFNTDQLNELSNLAKKCNKDAVNTTVITHSMILDLCHNSDLEKGLSLSPQMDEILKAIKDFNYQNIYLNPRLNYYSEYSRLIIDSLFEALLPYYDGPGTFLRLSEDSFHHRQFIEDFAHFLAAYTVLEGPLPDWVYRETNTMNNRKIYGRLQTKEDYYQAIIDYIAGMTDNYAVHAFDQLLMC